MRIGAALSEVTGSRKCKLLIPHLIRIRRENDGPTGAWDRATRMARRSACFFLQTHQPIDEPFPVREISGFPTVTPCGVVDDDALKQAERDLATAQSVLRVSLPLPSMKPSK